MGVVDIIAEQDAYAAHRYEFFLLPRQWRECSRPGVESWSAVRLVEGEGDSVPALPGVYTLLVQPGIVHHPACSYLMYVGKTKSLRRRLGEYRDERKRETGRPKILRLLTKYAEHTWFCYALVPEEHLTSTEEV